jgi:hypothetical protein
MILMVITAVFGRSVMVFLSGRGSLQSMKFPRTKRESPCGARSLDFY